MEPSVDIRRLNGALVVTWQGPILSGPTGEHFGASVPMPARPGLLLVIDLRGVSRIDAFGVGALMAIVRCTGQRRGCSSVVNAVFRARLQGASGAQDTVETSG